MCSAPLYSCKCAWYPSQLTSVANGHDEDSMLRQGGASKSKENPSIRRIVKPRKRSRRSVYLYSCPPFSYRSDDINTGWLSKRTYCLSPYTDLLSCNLLISDYNKCHLVRWTEIPLGRGCPVDNMRDRTSYSSYISEWKDRQFLTGCVGVRMRLCVCFLKHIFFIEIDFLDALQTKSNHVGKFCARENRLKWSRACSLAQPSASPFGGSLGAKSVNFAGMSASPMVSCDRMILRAISVATSLF